jgi:hypothetical protein
MIPKLIIQTGPARLPLNLRAAIANIKLLHPNFEYRFFNDDQVESFVIAEFPQYLNTFDAFPFRVQKYDFFRYLAIYRYGGFYLDLDVLLAEAVLPLLACGCVFSFEELTDSSYFWNRFRMDWQIGNYAFGASPKHPFLEVIIENCVRAQKDVSWVAPMMKWTPTPFRDENYILNTTGPGLVSRSFAENSRIAQDVSILFPDDVRDYSHWHQFGSFGVHGMLGSWRPQEKSLRRRLRRMWEGWKLYRIRENSRGRGKTREVPKEVMQQTEFDPKLECRGSFRADFRL